MSEYDPMHIEAIFADIAGLPPEERSRALENACGDDAALRAELQSLLVSYDSASRLFDDLGSRLPIRSLSELLDEDEPADPHGLVGKTISHFRVEEHLGGGGMGVVYRARDLNLPRDVALKLLPPEMSQSESAVARFKQEVIAASSIEHQNIAVVYEVGHWDHGQLFVAMAFYDGETLKKKIQRGPLPLQSTVDFGIGIADGLAEAHRRGIIHRDIKPANVMITRDGHVKVLDFGIAKVSDMSTMTASGSVVGTLGYMSPEQIRGEKVDVRTDIWSTGVVVYEMLTGVHPFPGEHQQAVIYQILNVDPAPISSYRVDVPPDVDTAIGHCLSKDRDRRFRSAGELRDALKGSVTVDTALPATVVPLWTRMRRKAEAAGVRLRMVAAGVAVAVLAAIVILFGLIKPEKIDLAVLPFSSAGADSALVNGLMYSVTGSLSRLEGLQGNVTVVPAEDIRVEGVRTSSDAARLFGVEYVVGGRVHQSADGISLELNLIDARKGRLAGSRSLEVAYANASRLQSDMVEALADLLSLRLGADAREELAAGNTHVSVAYDRYTRARGYLMDSERESNVDAAIGLLRDAVSEDAGYALAYAALGEAYLQKYRLTADRSALEHAVNFGVRARELNGELAPVRISLGLTYLEQGDFEKAELELLRANALEPNSAAVSHNLGKVYYRRNELAKAEQYYRHAIELNPDFWQYHNGLGIFYHYEGRHEDAAVCFRRVIQLRPANPWGYNNLGAQYQELGRWEDAMHEYVLATQVDTTVTGAVAFAHDNIARLYYTRRDFEAAAGWFEMAINYEDLSYDSWDQLGNAYHMLGRPGEAGRAWRRTIELANERLEVNPNDRNALNYLAEAHAKVGEDAPARATLTRLLSLERLEPNDYIVAAKIHEIAGRRDSALHYVEVALQHGARVKDIEASVWLDELREDADYELSEARKVGRQGRPAVDM